jgi:hypothetical protein
MQTDHNQSATLTSFLRSECLASIEADVDDIIKMFHNAVENRNVSNPGAKLIINAIYF